MTSPINHSPNFFRGLFVLLALALIWLCLTLSSCSCDYHARKVKKKCGTITDTLRILDTVITKEVSIDTVFKINKVRDTLVLRKENVIYKYFYNTKDSTIYLDGKCLSDTIIKTIKVEVEKTVVKIDYFPKWLMWLLIALGLTGIAYKLFLK